MHFQAQTQKSLQKVFRKLFLTISRPRPKNRSRRFPGSYFQIFPGPGPKVIPERFQGATFRHFQAQVQKSFQKISRKIFSRISRPRPKSRSRRLPGYYFLAFSCPDPKNAPEVFQEAIFEDFQAQTQKSLQKAFRKLFLGISRPRPKNHSRKLSESYF